MSRRANPQKLVFIMMMEGDIFAFLSLTLRIAVCYNNSSIYWDKAVCDPDYEL